MNAVQHPTKDELAAFSSGLVEESSLSKIEDHLADCLDCRAVMKSLPPDEMVTLLRDAMHSSVQPAENERKTAFHDADLDLPASLLNHPRYRIVGKLGSGGMGAVYLAEHRFLRRSVAIKIISRRLLNYPAAVQRFQREMEVVARLAHPNIAAAFDADHVDDVHFLVMELVNGCDLAKLVAQKGPLSVADACDYILQAANGLQHAHDRNLVHRDIKPHNLMLATDGTIKILDFGLACLSYESRLEVDAPATSHARQDALRLTDFGKGMGTLRFAAPEQNRDAHTTDCRADIYSLGCTLYFLLTGHAPPAQSDAGQALVGTPRQKRGPLDSRADVPAALLTIIARMMDRRVDRRMATMDEVARALAPFAHPKIVREQRSPRRSSLVLCAFGLGLFALCVLWFGYESFRPDSPMLSKEILRIAAHSGGVRNLSLSRSGGLLASVGADTSVKLWDAETGDQLREFAGHTKAVLAVAFSPDETMLVSGGADFTTRVWDVRDGRELRTFPTQVGLIHAVAFAPDGKSVASGCHDNIIRIWDLATGAEVQRFEGHQAGIMGIAFVPGTSTLLSCSNDQTTRLWNIQTAQEIRRYEGHTAEVMGFALASDGKHFVTGSHDGTVRLWDIDKEEELQRRDGQMNVTCVGLGRDGRHVLFGGWIGESAMSANLWDIGANAITHQMNGHQGRVSCVALTPDGKRAISGSEDGTIRIWQLLRQNRLLP
jgi:WD40 repeat protein